MTTVTFLKVQGAGNDFIFLNGQELSSLDLSAPVVAALCDRHFGIGADGVLLYLRDPDGTPRMRIFNADGSIAQMCGNGLRCFAMVLRDEYGEHDNPLTVATDAGPMECLVEGDAWDCQVTIEMGPVTGPEGGPITLPLPAKSVTVENEAVSLYRVATGNPHAIYFGETNAEVRQRLGPRLSTHPFFPEGSNIEFVAQTGDNALDVVVCERGVGFTLACGTGAVASAAVAVALRRCPADQWLDVTLPGGGLKVKVAGDFARAYLAGPAKRVFCGEVSLPEQP